MARPNGVALLLQICQRLPTPPALSAAAPKPLSNRLVANTISPLVVLMLLALALVEPAAKVSLPVLASVTSPVLLMPL